MANDQQKAAVLIVGGSVVGVSAALFLAARGIEPILVEKHPSVSTRLRAKLFYPRTMEAYRVGAAADIYAAERRFPPADHAVVVESLAERELRRWALPAAADFSAVSPCPSAFVRQAELEEVIRAHARAAGAELRFGHRFLGFRGHDDHVVAEVLDADGQLYPVKADYLLAADGNGSAIRESLGIRRSGTEVVANVMEIGFAADLRAVLAGRRLTLVWADGPERAFVSWTTQQDGGNVSVTYDPATTDPAGFDAARCRQIVLRALGLPAYEVTVTGTRTWQMGGWVADTYRVGRVFLLGDSAHVSPPSGGFGANTGIQDAWNLAAKLVSVLRGDAGPALLDEYEPERHAVAQLTVEQALIRMSARGYGPGRDGVLLSEAAVALGYRYPLRGNDSGLPMVDEPDRWRGEPGTRLPYVPLAADGASTLDLVRDGRYLVLTGSAGQSWAMAARAIDPEGDFLDVAVTSGATEACGIGERGALLVRPDQVIAWRASESVPDADAVLADVVRRVLNLGGVNGPDAVDFRDEPSTLGAR